MHARNLTLILLFSGMSLPLRAAEPAAEGKTWVLLIGVDQHANARLNRGVGYTLRDVDLLRKTLQQRAGIPGEQFLELSSRAADLLKPTQANLRREVPAFLAKAGPKDRVIVFFGGHGLIHETKAYLVPSDLDVKAIPTTGYPVPELRDALSKCRAEVKFFILDCCHSGAAGRSVEVGGASSETVAKSLESAKLPGTVILASCGEAEESFEWRARQQGIFTYWLCRGLEGGADEDGDGKLTCDEIYKYTFERVAKTAREENVKQTPVRIIGADVAGIPSLLTLRPEAPESLCRRLADHLDQEIRGRKLAKVGVLEFAVPLAKVEGLARANLPGYCAEQIRKTLAGLAGGTYVVLQPDQMSAAARGVRVEEIGDPQKMQEMEKVGLSAVVTGTIKRRGDKLHVACDLVATKSGDSLAKPAGVLPLSEEIAADNGASFDNRDRPNGSPYAPEVVKHVQEQSSQAHPLKSKDFPFKVEVYTVMARPDENITKDTPRRKKELVDTGKGTDGARSELVIGARKDEIIEIHVRNNTLNSVALVLLVDGMNTINGKRERLGEAQPWVLKPAIDYKIEGWYFTEKPAADPNKVQFKLNRFVFRDVAPVVGRDKFTDAPGVITAAFYAERGRDLVLDKLQRDEQRTLPVTDFKVGRLLGVANLRYVDAKDLD
jgi:uncharacterized caspase-like protein